MRDSGQNSTLTLWGLFSLFYFYFLKLKFTDIAFLQGALRRQVDGWASLTHRVEMGADAQRSPRDPLMLASDTGHGKMGHGTNSPNEAIWTVLLLHV